MRRSEEEVVVECRGWPRCTARLARCWYHACTHPMDPSIDVSVLARLVGQVAKKRARPCPAKPKRRVRRARSRCATESQCTH